MSDHESGGGHQFKLDKWDIDNYNHVNHAWAAYIVGYEVYDKMWFGEVLYDRRDCDATMAHTGKNTMRVINIC